MGLSSISVNIITDHNLTQIANIWWCSFGFAIRISPGLIRTVVSAMYIYFPKAITVNATSQDFEMNNRLKNVGGIPQGNTNLI